MSRRSHAPKTSTLHRPPEAGRVLSDLALIQNAGLRAIAELRGFASHDLTDMLHDALGSVAAVHTAAIVRLGSTS